LSDTRLKILAVSYFAPPCGGVQVQRIVKFLRYLPEYDIESSLLTVKPISHYNYDPDLVEQLPVNMPIYRSGSLDIFRIIRMFSFKKENTAAGISNGYGLLRRWALSLNSWIAFPDSRAGWYRFAVMKGSRAIRREKPDIIMATAPPYTALLVAEKLARKFNIPFVADFRDPWTGYSDFNPATKWHRDKAGHYEKKIIHRAALVISTTETTTTNWRKQFPDQPAEKFVTITNGFDLADWVGLTDESDALFKVAHVGQLFYGRNVQYILDAWRMAAQSEPDLKEKGQLRFVGTLSREQKDKITAAQSEFNIVMTGEVTYQEALQEMRSSSALLLLLAADDRESQRIPSKLFEYLASGRPIIAAVPDGEAAGVIKGCRGGAVVSSQNAIGLKEMILEYYRSFRDGSPTAGAIRDLLSRYERRNLTGQLADYLKNIAKNDDLYKKDN
jgi:glycosyltransferase involved in cell wall biosynthesis